MNTDDKQMLMRIVATVDATFWPCRNIPGQGNLAAVLDAACTRLRAFNGSSVAKAATVSVVISR